MKYPSLVVVLAFAVAGCSAPPPAPEATGRPAAQATPTAKPRSDLVTEAGRAIFRMKKGKPWLMEAFNVKYGDGQRQAWLDRVDWSLKDDQGRMFLRIRAPKAFYRMEQERVEFDGPVLAERYLPQQDTVVAQKMIWEGKTGQLRGSGGVSWTRGQTKVQGDTAVTTDKLERITVEGHVHVSTVLKESLDSGR